MDIRQYLSSAVSGSGSAGRVAIWSGANTLTSDANFTYDTGTDSFAAGLISSSNSVHGFSGRSLDLTYNVAASTAVFTVNHQDNTSGNSHAQIAATVGGASGGDPRAVFTVSGAQAFSLGIDNSDSDIFKIAGAATLGTAATDYLQINTSGKFTIGAASGTQLHDVNGRGWNIAYANSGVAMYCQMAHSSNSAGSSCYFYAQVGGASAGDPGIQFAVQSVTTWTVGLDNSASDSFVIANSAALGGAGDYMTITTAGAVGFVGTVTSTTSAGPQFIAKDGGTIGTNADPYYQLNDTNGLVGAWGFLTSNSTSMSLANYTATGSIFISTNATVAMEIESNQRVTIGATGGTEIHRINGATAATAGAAGDFLRLNVGGTNFKVQLYADS